jgi:hypothetical protein
MAFQISSNQVYFMISYTPHLALAKKIGTPQSWALSNPVQKVK